MISNLCGSVQELLLSSSQSRKSYDNYLALKDDVWSNFEKREIFGIKNLYISEYDKYLNLINSKVNDIEESNKMLAFACKFYQMTLVEDEVQSKLLDYTYCPYCGEKLVK